MCGEKLVSRSVDDDGVDGVIGDDGVDDVLTFGGFTKDGVLAVEVRSGAMGDEKLRSIGVLSRVGHA